MQSQITPEFFLSRLDDASWSDEDPRLDLGPAGLPPFMAALETEKDPKRRERLTRIIWQFRNAAALPALASALGDPCDRVWKEAIDGLVTLGGPEAISILGGAHAAAVGPDAAEKRSWIAEAIAQVRDGFYPQT